MPTMRTAESACAQPPDRSWRSGPTRRRAVRDRAPTPRARVASTSVFFPANRAKPRVQQRFVRSVAPSITLRGSGPKSWTGNAAACARTAMLPTAPLRAKNSPPLPHANKAAPNTIRLPSPRFSSRACAIAFARTAGRRTTRLPAKRLGATTSALSVLASMVSLKVRHIQTVDARVSLEPSRWVPRAWSQRRSPILRHRSVLPTLSPTRRGRTAGVAIRSNRSPRTGDAYATRGRTVRTSSATGSVGPVHSRTARFAPRTADVRARSSVLRRSASSRHRGAGRLPRSWSTGAATRGTRRSV